MGINNPNTPKKAFSVLLVFDQESANSKVSDETLTYMLRAISDYCARLNEFISRHYAYDNITVSASNGWPYADISIGGFLLEDSVSTTKVTNIRINNVPLFTRQSSLYENLPHAKYTKELRHNFMLLRDQYPESIAHCKDRVNDFLDILEAYAFYIEIDRANVHDWSRSKFAKPKMNFGYPPGMIQPGFTDTDRERLSEFNPILHPQMSSVADKISVVILGYDGSFSSNALVELADTLVKATQVKFELIPKNDSVRYTIRYDEIDAHATDTARSFTLTLFDYGVECKKKFFNLEKSSDTLVSFTSYIMGEFGKYLLELEGYFTNSISKLLVDLTVDCADGHTYNLRTQSVFSDDTTIVVLKRLTGKRLYTGMARIPAKADSLLEMIHNLRKSKQTIKLFKKH